MDGLTVAATILQVAGVGLQTSAALYQYTKSVSSADEKLNSIALEIDITSSVLTQLGELLKLESASRAYRPEMFQTAAKAAAGCKHAFEEIDGALQKVSERSTASKTPLRVSSRLMWPLRMPKIEDLRNNLDRLKSSLTMMLGVLSVARDLAIIPMMPNIYHNAAINSVSVGSAPAVGSGGLPPSVGSMDNGPAAPDGPPSWHATNACIAEIQRLVEHLEVASHALSAGADFPTEDTSDLVQRCLQSLRHLPLRHGIRDVLMHLTSVPVESTIADNGGARFNFARSGSSRRQAFEIPPASTAAQAASLNSVSGQGLPFVPFVPVSTLYDGRRGGACSYSCQMGRPLSGPRPSLGRAWAPPPGRTPSTAGTPPLSRTSPSPCRPDSKRQRTE